MQSLTKTSLRQEIGESLDGWYFWLCRPMRRDKRNRLLFQISKHITLCISHNMQINVNVNRTNTNNSHNRLQIKCLGSRPSAGQWGHSCCIWGNSPLLLMSLVDGCCVPPEPIGWLCLQLDFPPSVAELFRFPPLKSGTLYWNASSQLPCCSPSGVTLKRFYSNKLSAYSTSVDLVVALVTQATLENC